MKAPEVVRPTSCARCSAPITPAPTGRVRLYCSATCRVAVHDAARRRAAREARLDELVRAWRRERRAAALLSSDSVYWFTPPEVLDDLASRHGPFDLDPCADERSPAWSRIPAHWTEADDGLAQPWRGVVFCNPPYGRAIPAWVAKVIAELAAGRVERVVLLVPARPDTRWWADAIAAGAVPEFRRGRVRFVLPDGRRRAGAPFPSAALVFDAARFVGAITPTKAVA